MEKSLATELVEEMRAHCPPKTVLVVVQRGKNRSGLVRYYDVYSVDPKGVVPLLRWTWLASSGLKLKYNRKRDALEASTFMDIIRALGHWLWNDSEAYFGQLI